MPTLPTMHLTGGRLSDYAASSVATKDFLHMCSRTPEDLSTHLMCKISGLASLSLVDPLNW